jgi:outer membrane protein assembly factor BamB
LLVGAFCFSLYGSALAQDEVWSVTGPWTGVASDDRSGAIYALGPRGRCVELDSTGQVQQEIQLAGDNGSLLRLAHLAKDEGPSLLTYGVWSAELRAYDAKGNQLWNYPRAMGIDDVGAFDLDGDRVDEVIVGYNGGTGVHVLNSAGKLLWKSTAIANVWHVSAGHLSSEKTAQVVTTSAAGKVHVFSNDGKTQQDLDAGCYGSMVRVRKISPKDKTATIFVAGPALEEGTDSKKLVLNALAGDGTQKWSLELPAKEALHIDSAALAPGKPWLAVGIRGGQVHVVEIATGQVICSVNDREPFCEVSWWPGNEEEAPLLLVANRRKVSALRITEAK